MMLSLLFGLHNFTGPDQKALEVYGIETMMQIRSTYYMSSRKLYSDVVIDGKKSRQPAFDWGVGVMLSGLNCGAKQYAPFKPFLKEFADATRSYWNEKGPVPGYDVLPGPKPVDRYYDDNAWMVMALAETSEVLKDPKYLKWAEQSLRFVLSGKDNKLGGGIYWQEAKKTSKNTCSNGPAAAACLAVYRLNHDDHLLDEAKQIYAWTKTHLQDPVDKLFFDNVSLTGKIGKHKWTYNTALMIRTAVDLYTITHNKVYLDDATEMMSSSIKKWYSPTARTLSDEGKFAHLLLEAWMIYGEQIDTKLVSKEMVMGILTTLYEKLRNDQGFYGHRWDSEPKSGETRFELIDQASALRAFFRAGEFLNRAK